MTRAVLLPATFGMAAVLVSCGSDPVPRRALPPSPPVVEVVMSEYDFAYQPAEIPAGRVVFRVRNAGREIHRLTLLPLADEVPPLEQQLSGDRRISVDPIAEVPPRATGDSTVFAVDLVPAQRYAMLCFIAERGQPSHARKGMHAEFRTAGPRGQAPTTRRTES